MLYIQLKGVLDCARIMCLDKLLRVSCCVLRVAKNIRLKLNKIEEPFGDFTEEEIFGSKTKLNK